jgi:molybdopterin-containing oxidoreductase family membrane subunit
VAPPGQQGEGGVKKRETGALGVFEYLDDAIDAAKKLRGQGFPVQAITPTLFHELEEVVDPRRSNMRWITLVGALLGCAGGFALCIWTSLDWPIITGGKEIVSLPPFVVIGFECTILIGSLFNLAGMLLFSGLPNFVESEGYDRRFSEDRIGLWVPVSVDRADQAATLMKSAGAEEARIAGR